MKPFVTIQAILKRDNYDGAPYWAARVTMGDRQRTYTGSKENMLSRARKLCSKFGGTIEVRNVGGDLMQTINFEQVFDESTGESAFVEGEEE